METRPTRRDVLTTSIAVVPMLGAGCAGTTPDSDDGVRQLDEGDSESLTFESFSLDLVIEQRSLPGTGWQVIAEHADLDETPPVCSRIFGPVGRDPSSDDLQAMVHVRIRGFMSDTASETAFNRQRADLRDRTGDVQEIQLGPPGVTWVGPDNEYRECRALIQVDNILFDVILTDRTKDPLFPIPPTRDSVETLGARQYDHLVTVSSS